MSPGFSGFVTQLSQPSFHSPELFSAVREAPGPGRWREEVTQLLPRALGVAGGHGSAAATTTRDVSLLQPARGEALTSSVTSEFWGQRGPGIPFAQKDVSVSNIST